MMTAIALIRSALFGWEFDTSGGVAEPVSEAGNYGFVQNPDGDGIPGGVGGPDYPARIMFYVDVLDVEAALSKAESLGGTRTMGPERAPGSPLVVGTSPTPRAT
jgi:hypothetical protein